MMHRYFRRFAWPLGLLICIAMLAALSLTMPRVIDMTDQQRLSLSFSAQQVLRAFNGPIRMEVFVNPADQIAQRVQILLARFQREKADLEFNYLSPEEHPEKVREYAIRHPAELLIHANDQTQHLSAISEQAIINALVKLQHAESRRARFVTGHGERAPQGEANFDFGQFGQHLSQRGIEASTINLSEFSTIPKDTSLLVIASPQVAFLEHDKTLIAAYVEQGGNLLVLTDPNEREHTAWLLDQFGITTHPGVVVDGYGQQFRITQPDLVPFTRYPDHAITENFNLTTLLANSLAFDPVKKAPYVFAPLLLTSDQSWNERSPIKDEVNHDPTTETLGPLALALAIENPARGQRIVVVGDGDFLANRYLANGGNLDFGIRIFTWLSEDDRHVSIPFRTPSDLDFEMDQHTAGMLGFVLLVLAPGLLFGLAIVSYWRQKRG